MVQNSIQFSNKSEEGGHISLNRSSKGAPTFLNAYNQRVKGDPITIQTIAWAPYNKVHITVAKKGP